MIDRKKTALRFLFNNEFIYFVSTSLPMLIVSFMIGDKKITLLK